MRYTFPVIFTEERAGGYSTRCYDVAGVNTQGDTLQEALDMSSDALCLMLHDMEKRGEKIPAPSDIKSIKTGKGEFVQFVTCDTEFYERFFEKKSVRKNVTIPGWLDYEAAQCGLSYSAVLQEALKQRLHYK
jgi:predicted RNase H-like HicB family nuclease